VIGNGPKATRGTLGARCARQYECARETERYRLQEKSHRVVHSTPKQ
jgi:hypothetical protein